MKQFYQKIVSCPKVNIAVYIVLFVICIFCKQFISVNYDMNDYLPSDSPSTVALEVMEDEFGKGIPNARVMIEDVTIPEVLEYKEMVENIDGVSEVTWLDDAVSINTPLETMDPEVVENYYNDGSALFTITIDEDKRIDATNAIRDLIGNENALTGNAVSNATATQSTVKEIPKMAGIAIAFTLLVLLLTTTSWIEPIVVLIGLGVAVVINAGSNLIFGEISFVTNAAGNILQFAVSLDYSVFLLHRFTECRKGKDDAKAAMVEALCMSTTSILSSGSTTVIGFLALCLMQFQIGPDLGCALAKGIAISLITVFTFMPALILMTYKWIDIFEHRPLMPSFQKFGAFVKKAMIPMVIMFALIIVPAFLASNSNSFTYGPSKIFGTNTQLGKDTEKVKETFGQRDNFVLIVPKEDKATQKALSEDLHELSEVKSIVSYVDSVGAEIPESYLNADIYSKLCSDTYTRMVISVDTEYEGEDTFLLVEKIRGIAEEHYPDQWYLAGEGISTYDLMDSVTTDMIRVNLIAIGSVLIVLLLAMRSIVLPVILVLSIETAIWINLSIPYFADQTIFYIAYLIISSVQLGATVDYAILLTNRYKECRESMNREEAVVSSISAVTVPILTSGSVLTVVGFLLGIISTHGLLSQLGFFLGKGTLCSMIIVMFVLPGLLYLSDRFFIKKRKMEVAKNEE